MVFSNGYISFNNMNTTIWHNIIIHLTNGPRQTITIAHVGRTAACLYFLYELALADGVFQRLARILVKSSDLTAFQ